MYKIYKTNIKELSYIKQDIGLWRVIDTQYKTDNLRTVGKHYASKAELLADFDRYSKEWGY